MAPPRATPVDPLPWMTAYRAQMPAMTRYSTALPQWVIGMGVSGECEHGPPDGVRFVLGSGEMLAIRPRTAQRWQTLSGWDVISCIVDPRPHWLPWLDWDEVAPGFLRLRLAGDSIRAVQRCLIAAVAASSTGHADAADHAANALEAALLHCRRTTRHSRSGFDPRLRTAIHALAADLAHPHAIDDLAAHSGVSRAHLARLFREQVGVAPMAYLAQLRLQRAVQLLQLSDIPVKRIALEVGYPDQCYFSTWFRRVTGRTPGEHRRRSRR